MSRPIAQEQGLFSVGSPKQQIAALVGFMPQNYDASLPPVYQPQILFSPLPILLLMPNPNHRHVLSALVQNVPGVLAHISGMLASRGFNIDSLAVGETETPHLSRMTFVVVGDDRVLEQVGKQLEKIVTVVRVLDVSSRDFVERDLLLLQVKSPAGHSRSEIRELVDIFRGKIVDVGPDEVMVEISGRENKVQAFIERMRPYGITELVRTGRIAMVRSGTAKDAATGPDARAAS
jgi:acetolactate synthase-1/3 small subunit